MRFSALALLVITALLAGCGGGGGTPAAKSNGEAGKPAAQVLADAKKAVATASSLHVSGQGQSSGQPIAVDVSLVRGKGGTGTLKINGLEVQLVRIGDTVYVKGSDAFYQHFAGKAAAQLLHDKWLKGSATSGQLKPLAAFTGPSALFAQLAANHGTLVNKGTTTYKGQQVVEVRDVTKNASLYVAATGTAYPVAFVQRKAGAAGAVTFGDWNASVSLNAPSGAIDISSFGG
jgi:hypothetical protein